MNIQRYILPVMIAAAFHAALLSGSKAPAPAIRDTLKDPPPLPPISVVSLTIPPEDQPTRDLPVQELAGGPTPPSLDDPPVRPNLSDFTLTPMVRSEEAFPPTKIIPPKSGPGGPDDNGPQQISLSKLFTPATLDRIPRATVQPRPNYPAAMASQGITGSVVVEFDVDSTGQVVRANAIRWDRREFVDAAVRAVLQWHFEPGRHNGRAVPFRMAVPIEFNQATD